MSEDCRRCPKTTEEFRGEIRKFSTIFLLLHSPCERYLFYSVSSRVIVLPIFEEQIRIYNAKRLWIFHEKHSKYLTVFSTETVNIKKLANLTANTKNYGQITLNTKPDSDPLMPPFSLK